MRLSVLNFVKQKSNLLIIIITILYDVAPKFIDELKKNACSQK